ERIASGGADEFYEGETASLIAEDFGRNGGYLTLDDLHNYHADVVEPIESTYRDLRIVTENAPSVGPTTLEVINILEGWDVASLGANSTDYIDRLARALNRAFMDRAEHIGDPEMIDVPLKRLVSKEYADEVRKE